jgi:hypothetical protein
MTELGDLVAKRYTAKLPEDKLKERVLKFLKEQTMCVISTCKDNTPRATALEYFSEGTTLYLAPDPGTKLVNLAANPKISVAIFNMIHPDWTAEDWKRTKGVQITGVAKLLSPGDPEYAHAVKVYNWEPFFKALGQTLADGPKPQKMIKVEARRIEYREGALMLEGYSSAQVWEISK